MNNNRSVNAAATVIIEIESTIMKIDNLSEKRIGLGKCIISETGTPGIYRINADITVAAIGPRTILTGDLGPNDRKKLAELDHNLLQTDVALIREYVFGTTVAYNIIDLSAIKLPSFMTGNDTGGSIWPEFTLPEENHDK